MNSPAIDRRDQERIAEQLRAFVSTYANEWPTAAAVGADPQAETFVQIFARLMEIVGDRLNRAPDKNFLTFLRMLGMDLAPPRPAQAPLRFQAASGARAGGLIPAGTRVAVEGTKNRVVFETREDLEVVLPEIVRAVSFEPRLDRFSDHAGLFAEDEGGPAQSLFEGAELTPHRFYLGDPELFAFEEESRVELDIVLKYPIRYGADEWRLRWYAIDPDEGAPVEIVPEDPAAGVARLLDDGTLAFDGLAGIGEHSLVGYENKSAIQTEWPTFARSGRWIYAELATPLDYDEFSAAANIRPQQALAQGENVFFDAPFLPFRFTPPGPGDVFFVASADAFARPDATVVLHVELDATAPAPDTADVRLELRYWDGATWALLGVTGQAGVIDPGAFGLVDETAAFTTSGRLRFFNPAMQPRVEGTLESLWLRIELVQGGYGAGPTLKPPVVAALALERTRIPEIERVQARVRIDSPAPVAAERGFLNTQRLDLSRDFYPFGERPQFNDTFQFASKEVFAKAGADVTIEITLSPGLPAPDTTAVDLMYEYFDGEKWQSLGATSASGVTDAGAYGFSDGTNAFTQSGQLAFTMPPSVATEIRGQTAHWLRARMIAGDYGQEETFTGGVFVPATYRPPSIQTLELSYAFVAESAATSAIQENNFFFADATATLAANAAGPAAAWAAPFARFVEDSAAVYFGFDRDTANQPLSILLPFVARPFNAFLGGFNPDPPVISYEYWTGSQWSQATVNDRTENLTRREIIQILTPGDIQPRPVFGDYRHWLRLRLDRGSFLLKPELERLYTNTVWAENRTTLREETLGSSNGQPGQSFTLSRVPVLAGQRLIVREDRLTEEDRREILAEEGPDAIAEVRDEAGDLVETRVRWHPVAFFEFSGPRSRHYTIDRGTGQIVFGDGRRGFIPPPGSNNVLCEFYQVGGGEAGNVAEGINKLLASFAFVDSVDNPLAAEGGVDLESLDSIRLRGPRSIRNRNRAVTYEDFEALAREASGAVARVRALQTTDTDFQFRPGYVTVVIVPRSTEPKPFPSRELVNVVENYLAERTAGILLDPVQSQVNIIGPTYLRVYVEADIGFANIIEARQVELRIRRALDDFLHPLRGGPNGDGWEFGRNVFITEIYETIEDVAGVDTVQSVRLRPAEQIFDLIGSVAFTPAVPFPVQSRIELVGRRESAAGSLTVRLTLRLVESLQEDIETERMTAVGFKEGDFATLTDPFGAHPLSLLIRSVDGAFLEIDPVLAPVEYPAGSLLTLSGGQIRTTLTETIPVETELAGVFVAVPEAGDLFELTNPATTINRVRGKVDAVSADVSLVFLNHNTLPYPGVHVIRGAQNA